MDFLNKYCDYTIIHSINKKKQINSLLINKKFLLKINFYLLVLLKFANF